MGQLWLRLICWTFKRVRKGRLAEFESHPWLFVSKTAGRPKSLMIVSRLHWWVMMSLQDAARQQRTTRMSWQLIRVLSRIRSLWVLNHTDYWVVFCPVCQQSRHSATCRLCRHDVVIFVSTLRESICSGSMTLAMLLHDPNLTTKQ